MMGMGMPHLGGAPFGRPLGGCGYPQFMVPGQRPMMGGLAPGMPMPGLRGYRPHMLQPQFAGKQTPETVPVGVLATMLLQSRLHGKGSEFTPYKPLNSALTPQMLPPMEVPTQRLIERIEDFYQDLRDEDREESSSSSRSSSRSRSRSRSHSPVAQTAGVATQS